jgi:hypothetical protein
MRRLPFLAAATFAGVLSVPVAVLAHHSFSAEFDRDAKVTVTGTVTKVEWMNPHARFKVDAPDPDGDGKIVNWDFELASPNVLMRQGWTRNSLKPGDTVTVEGFRARTAPHIGNARSVTLADGRKVFAGSSADKESK